MVGRKPKPTKLRLLEGDRGHATKQELAHRDLEPQPDPRMPEAPAWLSPNARKKWAQLAPELLELGTLTHIDAEVLGGYCDACARLVYITHRYGMVPLNRVVSAQRKQALADLLKFGAELGIGASSRTRIEVRHADQDVDALADILASAERRSHRRGSGG